jgi:hypothetical protein
MFVEIDNIQLRLRRRLLSEEQARDQLLSIARGRTQTALEGLRLIASDGVAESAAGLWIHLRRRDEARDAYWIGSATTPGGMRTGSHGGRSLIQLVTTLDSSHSPGAPRV